MNAKILPQLKHLAVPLDSVNLDRSNPRAHPPKNLETIQLSLKRFGQRQPIVVQEEGRIVRAGNGRVIAARALGWKEIAAVVVPESSIDAVAYAIMDNRSAEMAEWDEGVLAQQLLSLQEVDYDLDLTGFGDEGLEELLAGLGEVNLEALSDEVDDAALDALPS